MPGVVQPAEDSEQYIYCGAFEGRRPGYIFKTGASGVGYYRDEAAPPIMAEFLDSRPAAHSRSDLPPGVVLFNGKRWKALEIDGGKAVLQMHRADGSGGLKRRVPLAELTAEENVAVREAVYTAKHHKRVADPDSDQTETVTEGQRVTENAAVAAFRAKYQARDTARETERATAIDGAISVTFTESGSLGLKFGQHPYTGAVVVKSINPGALSVCVCARAHQCVCVLLQN